MLWWLLRRICQYEQLPQYKINIEEGGEEENLRKKELQQILEGTGDYEEEEQDEVQEVSDTEAGGKKKKKELPFPEVEGEVKASEWPDFISQYMHTMRSKKQAFRDASKRLIAEKTTGHEQRSKK